MRPEARSLALAALAALAGALLGCASPTVPGEAPAYDPTVLTGGRVYHWPLGRAIAVHVHGGTAAETAALKGLVRDAADAWLAALRYREHAVRLVPSAADADVVVGFSGERFPVALDVCGGIGIGVARTVLCPSSDSALTLPAVAGEPGRVKMAVVLDGATLDAAQLAPVVTHELGHVLGIGGHSPDAADVMHADPRAARPSARDAATLRYVLHRPAAVQP